MRGIGCCAGGKSLMDMTASHMRGGDVSVFEGHVSCHSLAEAIVNGGYGAIPIVNREYVLIGIVTEYDLLNAMLKGKEMSETPATEIMTEPAIAITEDMSIEEIIALFQSRHLIQVPVIDSAGKLLGIVSRRDILACYVESRSESLRSSEAMGGR